MPESRPQRRRKSVNHYSDDNPNTFTVKIKKGPQDASIPPPPKRKTVGRPRTVVPVTAAPTSPKPAVSRKRLRVLNAQAPVPTDQMIAHAVSLLPVLPVDVPPSFARRTTPTHPCPAKSEWQLLDPPVAERLAMGPGGVPVRLAAAGLTCFAVRSDLSTNFCVGDAAGHVLLYQTVGVTRCMQILQTTASIREQSRPIVSKKVISYPNAVTSVAWRANVVVCGTASELEGLAVSTGNRLFHVPLADVPVKSLMSNRSCTSCLDIHPHKPVVLWTTGGQRRVCEEDDSDTVTLHQIEYNNDNDHAGAVKVVPVLPEGVTPNLFLACAALWLCLQSKTYVLAICHNATDGADLIQLAAGNGNGNSHYQVVARQALPGYGGRGTSMNEYSLSLGDGGVVFCCSPKGIRVFDATNLQLLTVCGESVALHGKTVLWQSARAFVRQPVVTDQVRLAKKQAWLARPDELEARSKRTHAEARQVWWVGVPHPTKGPTELASTLYLWQHDQQRTAQLQGPPGGYLGLTVVPEPSGHERWICVTHKGALWERNPVLQSDFGGAMYPVGFQVVQENVEYVEDEDELDQPVVLETDGPSTAASRQEEKADAELQEALLQSKSEEPIQVLLDDDDMDDDSIVVVPVRPALALPDPDPQMETPASPASPRRAVKDFLSALPQAKRAKRALQEHLPVVPAPLPKVSEQHSSQQQQQQQQAVKVKGKRTKTANVESLLLNSVVPDLQARMTAKRGVWATGVGVRLQERPLPTVTNEETMEQQSTTDSCGGGAPSSETAVSENHASEEPLTAVVKKNGMPNAGVATQSRGMDGSVATTFESNDHSVNEAATTTTTCVSESAPVTDSTAGDTANEPSSTFVASDASVKEDVKVVVAKDAFSEAPFTYGPSSTRAVTSSSNGDSADPPSEMSKPLAAPKEDTVIEPPASACTTSETSTELPETESKLVKTDVAGAAVALSAHNVQTEEKKDANPEDEEDDPKPPSPGVDDSKGHVTPPPGGVSSTPSKGAASQSTTGSTEPPNRVSSASPEEKEAALELLLLSPQEPTRKVVSMDESLAPLQLEPGNKSSSHPETEPGSTLAKEAPVDANPKDQDDVVMEDVSTHSAKLERRTEASKDQQSLPSELPYLDDCEPETQEALFCPACHDRMVMHVCGKREKPIDYDALDRAEKEKKAQEEAEKQRLKVAKRRAAEARRRESRRKKKEEEERKRREREEEEEKMRQLEASHFAHAHIQEDLGPVEPQQRSVEPSWSTESRHPTFSPVRSHHPLSRPSYDDRGHGDSRNGYPEDGRMHERERPREYYEDPRLHESRPGPSYGVPRTNEGYGDRNYDSYSSSWNASRSHGFGGTYSSAPAAPREPLRINGAEVKPSTCLSTTTTDALDALAVLAAATGHETTHQSTQHRDHYSRPSWNESNGHGGAVAESSHHSPHDYARARDRHTAITQEFTSVNGGMTGHPGYDAPNHVADPYSRPAAVHHTDYRNSSHAATDLSSGSLYPPAQSSAELNSHAEGAGETNGKQAAAAESTVLS